MLTALRERERAQLGRHPAPSAAIVDSQSVQAGERSGLHGYDGGKEVTHTSPRDRRNPYSSSANPGLACSRSNPYLGGSPTPHETKRKNYGRHG